MNARARTGLHDAVLLLLIAVIPALLSFGLHPKRSSFNWSPQVVEEMATAEVSTLDTPILWVDARSLEAFEEQHIPGAIRLTEKEWDQLALEVLSAWKPEMKVIVYCDSLECDASRSVAQRLRREFSLSNVVVLKGGWSSWQQAHP